MKLEPITDVAKEVLKGIKGASMYFTIGNNRVCIYPEVNIIIVNDGNIAKPYRLNCEEEEEKEPEKGQTELFT